MSLLCICATANLEKIGEVARVVHYLRKHLQNKKISSVQVQEDDIIYGKVGTSASAFKTAMTGRTVLDARQQGKYFWLVMDKPPHPVMHLGMTGWIKFSNEDSSYYRAKKEEEQEWPPRFWKFMLKTDGDNEVAFVDARRLARIRLVDVEGDQLRNTTPLKENGPDPVIDKEILTVEWLSKKMRSKKVPVKALLLDQANISGVGNWVADEVLYQARIHPEQYSNTFSDAQLKTLHDSLILVCTTAVDLLAESSRFPETWLMKYRWDKGKKGEVNRLPNGEKIIHLKVGGRTSAIVPSVQKKTGAVAGDVTDGEEEDDDAEAMKEEEVGEKKGRGTKRKAAVVKEEPETSPAQKRGRKGKAAMNCATAEDADKVKSKASTKKAKTTKAVKKEAKTGTDEEAEADGVEEADIVAPKKGTKTKSTKVTAKGKAKAEPETGRRRSGRLSGGK